MLLSRKLLIVALLSACCLEDHLPSTDAHQINLPGGSPDGGNRTSRSNGGKIIVTTVLEAPYMMLKERQTFLAGNDRFEGYLADILLRLSLTVGFEYEIRLVRDHQYGMLGPMGYWDGMIGEVHRGDADIAAGPLTITPRRLEVVDFTDPFLTLRSTALVKKPRPNRRRKPQRGNNHKVILNSREDSAEDVSEEQEEEEEEEDEEQRSRSRIRRIERLIDSGMVFGVKEGSLSQRVLRTSQNELYKQIWTKMVNFWPSAFVHSDEEGVSRVRSENYAYILDVPEAEYVAQRRPCDLYTMEPFLDLRQYAFALRKGDPLLGPISLQMRDMTRSREISSMYLKWWDGQCTKRPGEGPRRDSRTGPSTPRPPWQATAHAPRSGTVRLASSSLLSFSILPIAFRCLFSHQSL